MAHVFQMMAGTSRQGDVFMDGPGSTNLLDYLTERKKEANRFDFPVYLDSDDSWRAICSCPICLGEKLMTLSELGALPHPDSKDYELIPDIRIGATGIVLPDRIQLARWFKVPIPPKFTKSKFHSKAKRDGKQHATLTFFSTISFESVFFTPNLTTITLALLVAFASGFKSWSSLKKLAREEDRAIALELTVRKHAFRARNAAWEKLYYCSGCGMVHDREGKRSLPWYSMLQLVHYPEQEFHTIDVPIHEGQYENSRPHSGKSRRAA